jgi:protein O-mannosyl-transferase
MTDPATLQSSVRLRMLAACGLIIAAGFAAYANTYSAPFVYDGRILERELQPLAWENPAGWFEQWPRPLGYFTFRLQYTLHGRWLPGFHAVNIAIHVLAALFLFGSVYLTCRSWRPSAAVRSEAIAIALAAALLFELHPLQTQSVTYLYQRFESLMGMFFLASVFCFAMGCREPAGAGDRGAGWRSRAWLVAAWLAVVASIASKEVGAAAPLVLLWYDRVFVADSWQTLARRRGWFHAPFFALMAGCAAFLFIAREHYAAGGIFNTTRMPVLTYALHQPYVICRYLGLVVWPRGLCLDWAMQPLADPRQLVPAIMAVFGLLGCTAWAAVRLPWAGFLLGSFFLILAPTSSFAPIVDLAFEHRMYLPLAPLSVLAALGIRWLANRAQVSRRVLVGAVAGLAIALGILTYRRNEVYESGTRVWVDVIEKAPRNARAFFNLAWHVEEQPGGIPTAIKLYRRALEISPAFAAAHRSLAVLLFTSDRPQAVWHARQAVGLERSADNLSNLGIVIAEEDPREAEACFREALTLSPSMAEAKANLAQLLAREQAVESKPTPDRRPRKREPALSP